MSEREKLARLIDNIPDDYDHYLTHRALYSADRIIAAGYRLVATEGPEFEARAAAGLFANRSKHDCARDAAHFWECTGEEGREAARRFLRAALETGERDG